MIGPFLSTQKCLGTMRSRIVPRMILAGCGSGGGTFLQRSFITPCPRASCAVLAALRLGTSEQRLGQG
jgi:hypothetical protein